MDMPNHMTPQNLRASSGGTISSYLPPFFRERDASSRQRKAKPFGRPSSPDGLAHGNFACVVIHAGDGERDGGFDSGSRDFEPLNLHCVVRSFIQ